MVIKTNSSYNPSMYLVSIQYFIMWSGRQHVPHHTSKTEKFNPKSSNVTPTICILGGGVEQVHNCCGILCDTGHPSQNIRKNKCF